jgi:hypothetical protein
MFVLVLSSCLQARIEERARSKWAVSKLGHRTSPRLIPQLVGCVDLTPLVELLWFLTGVWLPGFLDVRRISDRREIPFGNKSSISVRFDGLTAKPCHCEGTDWNLRTSNTLEADPHRW